MLNSTPSLGARFSELSSGGRLRGHLVDVGGHLTELPLHLALGVSLSDTVGVRSLFSHSQDPDHGQKPSEVPAWVKKRENCLS